jgi:hypothetical protein
MTTLVSEFVLGGIDRLRKGVEESLREQHHFTAQEMRDGLDGCRVAARALGQFWDDINERLDEGIEGGELRSTLEKVVATSEVLARLCERVRDVAVRESLSFRGKEKRLEGLLEDRDKATTIHGHAQTLLARVSRPQPPIDPSKLPTVPPGPDAGGYVELDDILKELRGERG